MALVKICHIFLKMYIYLARSVTDILGKECDRLYTAWNVSIRQILKIDRCTHRFLIEHLSDCLHLKTKLVSRYASFYQAISNSKKFAVHFLGRMCASDLRTVLGRTLQSIAMSCNMKPGDIIYVTPDLVKKGYRYKEPTEEKVWQANLAYELLQIREGNLNVPGFSTQDIKDLLKYACIS